MIRRWFPLLLLAQAAYAFYGRHERAEAAFWVVVACLVFIGLEVRELRYAIKPGHSAVGGAEGPPKEGS